ncbi:MAG: SET domain-containing protein-lysine N-methyltransferase [Planctomycetes bacterium]|nr:SET domain-containing protein-lysine N-methyltransferase [Planctomycetota bacterium]
MMHPSTSVQFIADDLGHGVVATAFIPKGTITWVQDPLDRVFSPAEIHQLTPSVQALLEYYAFRNARGEMVLCWDHARYVNHSFRSNCLSTAYDFEIAVRDIHPGEQLTDDYGYLNLSMPWRPSDEGTRRKWVRPDDLLRYAQGWDRSLGEALRSSSAVAQPLLEWLPAETCAELQRIQAGEASMRSIRELYFAG